MTAVLCSSSMPRATVRSDFDGGAAMLAVTIIAAIAASSRTCLRIDPPRRAAQQQHERGIDGEEEHAESDLPEDRCFLQRIGIGVDLAVDVDHHDDRRIRD